MLETERARKSGAGGLRARKKAEKRERIVAAGRDLFVRLGFEATSTRAIAERAGIGAGTLFSYFPGKTDLLFHIFRLDVARTFEEACNSIPEYAEPLDALMHVCRHLFEFYDEDRPLSRAFIKEFLFARDSAEGQELQSFSLASVARLGSIGRAEKGSTHDVDNFHAGYIVFGVYYFTLSSWLNGALPDRETALGQLRRSLKVVVAGLEQTEESSSDR